MPLVLVSADIQYKHGISNIFALIQDFLAQECNDITYLGRGSARIKPASAISWSPPIFYKQLCF